MCEQWAKAAMMQNPAEGVIKHNVIALKDANTTEGLQHIVNTYMYDSRTGLLRGQIGATLYLTETGDEDADRDVGESSAKQSNVQQETSKTAPNRRQNQKTAKNCTQLSTAKGKVNVLVNVAMASVGIVEGTGAQGESVQILLAVMQTWLQSLKARAKAKEKANMENRATKVMVNQVANTMVIGPLEKR